MWKLLFFYCHTYTLLLILINQGGFSSQSPVVRFALTDTSKTTSDTDCHWLGQALVFLATAVVTQKNPGSCNRTHLTKSRNATENSNQ